jgi:hypothetical protein
MNHRDAGAFERKAPLTATPAQPEAHPAQVHHTNRTAGIPSQPPADPAMLADEILVVVSKVKKYIKDQSGMNTSDSVMDVLSKQVRKWADSGVKTATLQGRKTVMERDL